MCLDDLKGEAPKGDVFWIWAGGLMGFFFSRLAEFFNSLTSDNLSALLNSPSWMYAKCVAHVSRPSKMCVAYTTVAPLYRKYVNIITGNMFTYIGCYQHENDIPHHMIYWCVKTVMHI